jgi:ribosomal protein S18 acetylase RimI-like enzyme
MEVRRATDADAEAISLLHRDVQALHAQGLPHLFRPPNPDSFAADRVRSLVQSASVRLLIGTLGGAPAGYVFAEIVRQGGSVLRLPLDYLYVNHLAVAPALRRRGYGGRLLCAATDLARAEGVAGVALDVWAFNEAARAFYAKHGFAPQQLRLWRDVPAAPAPAGEGAPVPAPPAAGEEA